MRPIDRREFLQTGRAGLALPVLATSSARATRAPKRVKVGQIGVGHGHATKIEVFRASDDYEVVGIVEPDAELRTKAEGLPPYRGLKWMSQTELLETPGLDMVLVETRVADLLDAAEACLAAGKHVHLDKPAGASLPRFQRLLDIAERDRLVLQMGYMFRYNPAIVLLRRFLERGWLGEVFEVHGVMSKVVGPDDRARLGAFSGGMMFELGCHLIDLIVSVLGKPDEVTPFLQHVAKSDDRLTDNTLAVLRYPRALASVKSSALEVDGFARRHLVVCGTEGTFHVQPLDNPKAIVSLAKPRESITRDQQVISFPPYRRYVDDAADLARMIRGEKTADFPPRHDRDVQETVLRAAGMPLNV